MSKDNELSLRFAEGDEDCRSILRLLIEMHKEVGRTGINFTKGCCEIDRVVKEKFAIIIWDGDKAIGSAGIIEVSAWYSDDADSHLTERWFYVLPEYRRSSKAFEIMFDEIRQFATEVKLPAMLTIFNPDGPRDCDRLATDGMRARFVAEKFFFQPAGAILEVIPEGA